MNRSIAAFHLIALRKKKIGYAKQNRSLISKIIWCNGKRVQRGIRIRFSFFCHSFIRPAEEHCQLRSEIRLSLCVISNRFIRMCMLIQLCNFWKCNGSNWKNTTKDTTLKTRYSFLKARMIWMENNSYFYIFDYALRIDTWNVML